MYTFNCIITFIKKTGSFDRFFANFLFLVFIAVPIQLLFRNHINSLISCKIRKLFPVEEICRIIVNFQFIIILKCFASVLTLVDLTACNFTRTGLQTDQIIIRLSAAFFWNKTIFIFCINSHLFCNGISIQTSQFTVAYCSNTQCKFDRTRHLSM